MHSSHHTRPGWTACAAALLLLASLAGADISKRHVQLVTPQPFEWDEYGPTNPLDPSGSDYPCKVKQGDTFRVDGAPTEMVHGEDQEVSFAGWAVHGGGSCQFALAEGWAPTSTTAWKVIHSIEGGCPKANVTGNLAQGQSPDTYTFSVPDDFAPGNYTFAWTWVNRIAASPEFYMNCAPIAVKASAAAGSTERVKARRRRANQASSYPDLFLANIGDASNGCTTADALAQQIAIEFPSPGDSVSYPNGIDNLYKQPCDGNTRNTGSTAASGSSQSAATGAGTSATTSTTSTSTVVAVSTSVASVASASPTTLPTTVVVGTTLQETTTTAISTTSSSAAAAATAAASSTGTATSLSSPCTDGHLLCVDGTQFSTCTGGTWDTPQDLAQNTTCVQEGESTGLDTTYHWD